MQKTTSLLKKTNELYKNLEKIILNQVKFLRVTIKRFFWPIKLKFIFYRINLTLKLEKMFGYPFTTLSSALLCGSFCLVSLKLLISSYIIIHPILNFSLLSIFFIFSLKFNLYFYIRKFIYHVLFYTMGLWYKGYALEGSWKDILADDTVGWTEKDLPKDYWYHKLLRVILTFIIYIRLIIISEPYIFLMVRLFFFYYLIFNKLIIITYFLSFFFMLSHFLLFMVDRTHQRLLQSLSQVEYTTDIKKVIVPTWQHATYLLCWITRHYETRDGEINDYKFRERRGGYYCIDCRLENINYPVLFKESYNLDTPYYKMKKRNALFYPILGIIITFIVFSKLYPGTGLPVDYFQAVDPFIFIIKGKADRLVQNMLYKFDKTFIHHVYGLSPNIKHASIPHTGLMMLDENNQFHFSNTTTIKKGYNYPFLNIFPYNDYHAIVGTPMIYHYSKIKELGTLLNLEPATSEQQTAWETFNRYPIAGVPFNDIFLHSFFKKAFLELTDIPYAPAAQFIEFSKAYMHLSIYTYSNLSLKEHLYHQNQSIRLFDTLAKRGEFSAVERQLYTRVRDFRNNSLIFFLIDTTSTVPTLTNEKNSFELENFTKIDNFIVKAQKKPRIPIAEICYELDLDNSYNVKTYNIQNSQKYLSGNFLLPGMASFENEDNKE